MDKSIVTIIDPIDDPRWNEFVKNHPLGWICHLSGWKEVLEKSFKHMKGYYLVRTDESGANILSALPVFEVRSWLTGRRLVSIPYATLCDPLISSNEDMMVLFEFALKLSKKLKCSYVEIRTFFTHSLIQDDRLGKVSFYKHHFLSSEDNPETLKSKFHRTCVRQRISRAVNSGLKLKIGKNKSDLEQFYQLYLTTRKRINRPPMPFRFIESLWEVFYPENQLTLLLAEKDGENLAGMLLFKYKDRVSAEFAVSDENYKSISPNHYLFWEAIKIAHTEGYKIFDFGRTAPSNYSLMDFKNRWNTQIVDLPHFYFPGFLAKKSSGQDNSIGSKVVSKICEKAPAPIFRLVGDFVYRHLG